MLLTSSYWQFHCFVHCIFCFSSDLIRSIFLYNKMTSVTTDTSGVMYNISRACTIYCEGPVLQTIQLAQIYNDSKTFVDMPMIYEPEQVMTNFLAINDTGNVTQLQQFLSENFYAVGSDLVNWVPIDYQTVPPIYNDLPNSYPYKQWLLDLNNLWLMLGRNVTEEVVQHPEKHSFLPRPHPMIVPGGRFRESYYWDSYWIVRGLLVCNMNVSSYYVIQNLLSDIENFGFVANGGRIYYLDRSQPPLLSEMVFAYYRYMLSSPGYIQNAANRAFLSNFTIQAYDLLQREYSFFMNSTKGHVVRLVNPHNASDYYYLNRYYSNYTSPRPESYLQDYDNSLQGSRTAKEVNFFYQSTRAGAETGWDFSSRWILGDYNISDIDTLNIIPVELNTFLYQLEVNLAKLTVIVNSLTDTDNQDTVDYYINAALSRYTAMQTFLWDNQSFHWRDYNITSNQFVTLLRENYTSIAYWLPLWAGIYPDPVTQEAKVRQEVYAAAINIGSQSVASAPAAAVVAPEAIIDTATANKLVQSLQASGLLQVGGVLTTNLNTGQQWDSPNAWPPLVSMTIEALQRLNTPLALSLANNLTFLWLNTCYIAYNHTGYMYEKYNAFHVGQGGGGGEYTPQVGFGWTNGVILTLINETYRAYIVVTDDDSSSDSDDGTAAVVATLVVFFGLLFITMAFFYANPDYYFAMKRYCCGPSGGSSGNGDDTPTAAVTLSVPLAKAEVVHSPMV